MGTEMNLPHSVSFALWLASLGWLVVPLHAPTPTGCTCGRPDCRSAGKHPRTPNGLKDASKDPQVIEAWWRHEPVWNVGVVTGAVSNIIVIDVDPRHGGDVALAQLQHENGPFPLTPESRTGGGGTHYVFEHPGDSVANSSGRLGAGLDLKADGGLIVAPPSLHASGQRYEWVDGRRPDQLRVAPVPPWLLGLIQAKKTTPALARVERADLVKNGAVEGTRNASVASLAGHLLRRGVDPHAVVDLLSAWNRVKNKPPLPEVELFSTIDSIAGLELARRRGGRHE
ncbi:MAG: hypothetical protein AMXMBFR34_28890 [Myxococcaceae bacterium]